MKVTTSIQIDSTSRGHHTSEVTLAQFVPIAEIKRRVARIKGDWTPETAAARAAEGERRLGELTSFIDDLLADESCNAPVEDCEFSVVG